MIAYDLAADRIPHALYWDTADPYHYLRVARGADGGELLIAGGCDHRTGQGDPEQAFLELDRWVRRWIPVAGAIVARWSGQILEPADGLAHIGRSPGLEHVYVVSGDSGEGLTYGTIDLRPVPRATEAPVPVPVAVPVAVADRAAGAQVPPGVRIRDPGNPAEATPAILAAVIDQRNLKP